MNKSITAVIATASYHTAREYKGERFDHEAYAAHSCALKAADASAYAMWKNLGYSPKWEESGETDVGGNPISGPVTVMFNGKPLEVGSWGPSMGETYVKPPSMFSLCPVCGGMGGATGDTYEDTCSPGPCHSS